LPAHGFKKDVPTYWILEGLVMYLQKDENEKLIKDISDLSCTGSSLLIN
jgi:O-methyltransferase involved in polyketide biosynthesis